MKNYATMALLLVTAACGREEEVSPTNASSGNAGAGGMTTTTSINGGNGGMGGNNVGGEAAGGYGGSGNCDDISGKFVTYSQGGWNNQAELLSTLVGNGVLIGKADADYASFTNADAVVAFLPAGGTPNALQGQYVNPATTPAGNLAGQALSLKLNALSSNQACGYTLADLVATEGDCKDMSVSEVLELSDLALSGAAVSLSYSSLKECARKINENFDYGGNNGYLRFP
ncbi:MAG: hypothetical protein AABX05_04280 [Nanoarchaeota archaeon]